MNLKETTNFNLLCLLTCEISKEELDIKYASEILREVYERMEGKTGL